MSVKLKTASNGSVTLAPEDTASDVTLTVPAVTATLLNNLSDIEVQSKTALNATGSAPIYACRAWVNFNGQGTVAIRASGNVSSITDGGVGIFAVNFTTAMPDSDYAPIGSASTGTAVSFADTALVGQADVRVRSVSTAAPVDVPINFVAVFR